MKINICMLVAGCLLAGGSSAFALSDENRPEYQKEFDAYLKDLNVIEQTGKAPRNRILESDLAKMSSNQKILLNVPRHNKNQVHLAQNEGAKIVNSVEIIRVPEEFRKDYAEVYHEEKTISAQSLVEDERAAQREMIANDADKITNHLNPFRFLKEVALSPEPGSPAQAEKKVETPLDPMVEAYFN